MEGQTETNTSATVDADPQGSPKPTTGLPPTAGCTAIPAEGAGRRSPQNGPADSSSQPPRCPSALALEKSEERERKEVSTLPLFDRANSEPQEGRGSALYVRWTF